jgi:UDP:flavonoid glycosyltransferase YjiC (YdhE family)
MYDQFDNGDRVRLLGVGNMLLPDHCSPEKLIEVVRALTTSAQVKANLQRFRDELAGTNAVSLERAIRQRESAPALRAAERLRAAS